MVNREKKKSGGSFFLKPGLLTQELKTPERLWMAVLLLNQYETTPTIEEPANGVNSQPLTSINGHLSAKKRIVRLWDCQEAA